MDRLEQELRLSAGVQRVGAGVGQAEQQETLVVVMAADARETEIDAMWELLLGAEEVDDFTLLSNAGQDYFSKFAAPGVIDGDQGPAFLVRLEPEADLRALIESVSTGDGVFAIENAMGKTIWIALPDIELGKLVHRDRGSVGRSWRDGG